MYETDSNPSSVGSQYTLKAVLTSLVSVNDLVVNYSNFGKEEINKTDAESRESNKNRATDEAYENCLWIYGKTGLKIRVLQCVFS
jgi:hypothetical protein